MARAMIRPWGEDAVSIFCTDYDTPDGTCIRDYIHVEDLAHTHLCDLTHLADGGDSQVLNCGYGRGFSVRDVLETVQKVSGREIAIIETGRRSGDPAELVADNRLIGQTLGWAPQYDDLGLICRTAYQWECKTPC